MYLKHPFNMILAGPTQSGKSTFVKRLVNDKRIIPQPIRIIFYYAEWQKSYEEIKHPYIEFRKGAPTNIETDGKPTLIILDDIMSDISNSKDVVNLFTRGTHHRNCSVILIMQNLYQKGSTIRTASLNAHYLCIFRILRDRSQIRILSRQMYPERPNFLTAVFEDATKDTPHSYLFIDLTQDAKDDRRVWTNIF